jgi:hypothetical protein
VLCAKGSFPSFQFGCVQPATSGPSIRPRKLSTILVRRILTNQLFENPKPMTDITIRCKQSSGLPDRSATFLGQKICIAQPSIW